MKRVWSVVMALLWVALMSIPGLGAGARLAGTGTVEDIDKYWAQNGYPEDVGFAYEAGGELLEDDTVVTWWEIGLVDGGEQRRQEILSLISPNCRVTFLDCEYSYSRREAVLREIQELEDGNIQSAILILNTDRILVVVEPGHLEEYKKLFGERYGNLVQVQDRVAGVEDMTIGETGVAPGLYSDGGEAQGPSLWGWTAAAAAVAVLGSAALLLAFRRRVPVRQTTAGDIEEVGALPTRREVEQAVRESTADPEDGLLEKLKRELEER